MADLSFYKSRYGITTETTAFDRFVDTLQNYYDAGFYVNWGKVFANSSQFEREFALLSTLCNKPDKRAAAKKLFEDYPQVIPALPILLATRGVITLLEDGAETRVTEYDFRRPSEPNAAEADKYSQFIVDSGLIELLERIQRVPDYVTGVEVGMDTNARKNRGGECGVRAINPWVADAQRSIPGLHVKNEASYDFLIANGCPIPASFSAVVWDKAFWLVDKQGRFVVMEINHYGGGGSKLGAIAREYTGRQRELAEAGVGFIWVTDGLGWLSTKNALREAFNEIPYLVNVKLASEGLLEYALRAMLLGR